MSTEEARPHESALRESLRFVLELHIKAEHCLGCSDTERNLRWLIANLPGLLRSETEGASTENVYICTECDYFALPPLADRPAFCPACNSFANVKAYVPAVDRGTGGATAPNLQALDIVMSAQEALQRGEPVTMVTLNELAQIIAHPEGATAPEFPLGGKTIEASLLEIADEAESCGDFFWGNMIRETAKRPIPPPEPLVLGDWASESRAASSLGEPEIELRE